jgi:hypothetical protein
LNMIIGYILIALLLLLLIIIFSSIRIGIHFQRVHQNDQLGIDVKALFGLLHLKYEIPIIKIKERFPGVEVKTELESGNEKTTLNKKRKMITPGTLMDMSKRARKKLREVYGLLDWVKQTLRYIRCEKLTWYSKIGTGDAAETGILTGLTWGVKTSLLGIGLRHLTLRTVPSVNVTPMYNQRYFHSELKCILRIRVGHAILAGIRFLPRFLKGKGGEGKWQSTLFKV